VDEIRGRDWDWIQNVEVDEDGFIYCSGSANFNITAPVVDGWIFKLDPEPVSVQHQSYPRIPLVFSLNVYPNPFNAKTTVQFGLPEPGRVSMSICNILGQQVIQLVDGYREAGYHDVTFDAMNLASGMYFYRIEAGEFSAVRKMVLVK